MLKKRISLLMVLVLSISLMVFAAGCSSEESVESTPVNQSAVEQISEEEVLTNAAIDYFKYLQGTNMIDAEKTNEGLANLYVIDIRAAEDFAKGHVPNSVNIPMASMGDKIPELPKDKTLVIVCYSGQTASQTTGVLRMAGFDALALKGGFPSWEKAGLEIQQ